MEDTFPYTAPVDALQIPLGPNIPAKLVGEEAGVFDTIAPGHIDGVKQFDSGGPVVGFSSDVARGGPDTLPDPQNVVSLGRGHRQRQQSVLLQIFTIHSAEIEPLYELTRPSAFLR